MCITCSGDQSATPDYPAALFHQRQFLLFTLPYNSALNTVWVLSLGLSHKFVVTPTAEFRNEKLFLVIGGWHYAQFSLMAFVPYVPCNSLYTAPECGLHVMLALPTTLKELMKSGIPLSLSTMEIKQYYCIRPSYPGGIDGNHFVFDDWDGVEIIQSGADFFVSLKICEYLVAEELAVIKRCLPVVTESQYDEICGLPTPGELYQIELSPTLYDADLALYDDGLICTDTVADDLKALNGEIWAEKCIPMSLKCASNYNPLTDAFGFALGTWKESALHWQAAKILPLDLVGKPDAEDQFGFTALHEAICADHVEAVAQLLSAGASLYIKTKHGYSALDFALKFDRAEVLKLLVSNGLAVPGNELIHAIFSYKAMKCFRLVSDTLENIDERSSVEEPTYLMQAIRWCDIELADMLLQAGADPNATREGLHEDSVLGLAIRSLEPELVKMVLEYGADPNLSILRRVAHPPLMSAVMIDSDPCVVEMLLQYGANKEAPLETGTVLEDIQEYQTTGLSDLGKQNCQIILDYEA